MLRQTCFARFARPCGISCIASKAVAQACPPPSCRCLPTCLPQQPAMQLGARLPGARLPHQRRRRPGAGRPGLQVSVPRTPLPAVHALVSQRAPVRAGGPSLPLCMRPCLCQQPFLQPPPQNPTYYPPPVVNLPGTTRHTWSAATSSRGAPWTPASNSPWPGGFGGPTPSVLPARGLCMLASLAQRRPFACTIPAVPVPHAWGQPDCSSQPAFHSC